MCALAALVTVVAAWGARCAVASPAPASSPVAPAPEPVGEAALPPPLDPVALVAMRDACELAAATCDPAALLSPIERRAVERALAARGARVDRAPAGKRIARVLVHNFDVFGPDDGVLRWLNAFHVTTRPHVVARELELVAGDRWVQPAVDSSARRLRDFVSTAVAVIVPLARADGEVDLLVVIRDVWSLRLNSAYEFQDDQLTFLMLSLSENNLFGMRRLLQVSFRLDQGSYFVGPVYIDKNVGGTHLDLRARVGPRFNRQTSALEGSESVFELSHPFWAVDTRWAGGVEWSHRDLIERSFLGSAVRTYDAPETPEDDALPYEFDLFRISMMPWVARGWGDELKRRVRGGYHLVLQRPESLPGLTPDPALRAAFERDVLPRSERTAMVFVGGELYEQRHRNYQDVDTYHLAEDTQMGGQVEGRVGAALRVIGSEEDFLYLSGAATYALAIGGDGLVRVKAAGATRVGRRGVEDASAEASLRLVSPGTVAGRLVAQLRVAGLFEDTQNQFLALGGDNGLRGYDIGAFTGARKAVLNAEYRSPSAPLWFTRWGLNLFYDAGGVADTVDDLALRQDVGVGLRGLIPQLDPGLFRFDFAFPLDGPEAGALRFSGGYEQAF